MWTNFTGGVAEGGNTLVLTAIRELAGQYTCSVPTVPEIIPFVFDMVVHCKLRTSECILMCHSSLYNELRCDIIAYIIIVLYALTFLSCNIFGKHNCWSTVIVFLSFCCFRCS